MEIKLGGLSHPSVHALLIEYLQSTYALSPPESVHALDIEKLRQPGINFCTTSFNSHDPEPNQRLSLETGSVEAFLPAQRLYESFGFTECGPFGDDAEDPNSVFMTMRL